MALACATTGMACRRDPAAAAARFVESGDRYVQSRQYRAAILEYRNALEHQPESAAIHARLARAYEAAGDPRNALASLSRVAALDETNVAANLRVSRALLEMQRFEDARQLVERVLRREPRHVEALSLLATVLAGTGQAKAAEAQLAEAFAIDPHARPALLVRASWQMRDRKFAEAKATLKTLVQQHPDAADGWLALGTVEWQTGAIADAERSLLRGLELSTDKPPVHRMLASYYVSVGKAQGAEAHLKAVADKSSEDRLRLAEYYIAANRADDAERELGALVEKKKIGAVARLRRAQLRYARGQKPEAERDLEVAIADDEVEPDARLVKSRMLMSEGQIDAALGEAKRVAEAHPARADASYAVALAAIQKQDWPLATEWLERTRTLTNRPAALDLDLARVALAAGRSADAVRHAKRAADSEPRLVTILGMAKQADGDGRGAQAAYERALQREPRNGVAANNLAWLYAESGRLTEALRLARRANEILQGAPQTLDTLGWVHHRAGRHDEAIRAFRLAREKQPQNPTYHHHLGAAYIGAGQREQARESLEQALRLSPSFEGAEDARRMLAQLREIDVSASRR